MTEKNGCNASTAHKRHRNLILTRKRHPGEDREVNSRLLFAPTPTASPTLFFANTSKKSCWAKVVLGLFFLPTLPKVVLGLFFLPTLPKVVLGLFFLPTLPKVVLGLIFLPTLPKVVLGLFFLPTLPKVVLGLFFANTS